MILTDTPSPVMNEPRSNGNEKVTILPSVPEQESHDKMQVSVMTRKPFVCGGGILPLFRRCSQCILDQSQQREISLSFNLC